MSGVGAGVNQNAKAVDMPKADDLLADLSDPIELRILADKLQRYLQKYPGFEPEEFGDLIAAIRARANQIQSERELEQRKIDELARFVCRAVPDWQLDPTVKHGSLQTLAAALLDKFDMDYKDKSGPPLGGDYDPDDYK